MQFIEGEVYVFSKDAYLKAVGQPSSKWYLEADGRLVDVTNAYYGEVQVGLREAPYRVLPEWCVKLI